MINKVKLSERLKVVASFIPKGSFFADIGSDHAYLPCYVCLHDHQAKAIAGEINMGPYESANKTVRSLKLEDKIDVRLGDGLEVIKDHSVDTVTIAGMGGTLITQILSKDKHKLNHVNCIIIQPNNNAYQVRKWFYNNKYTLTNEQLIEENDIIYEVLVANKHVKNNVYQNDKLKKQLLFGPYLMQQRTALFIKKWTAEYEKKQAVICSMQKSNQTLHKLKTFETQLKWMEEVLEDE